MQNRFEYRNLYEILRYKYELYSVYVFDIFMFFVGCKGWEVDIENYRNGNNL